MPISILDFFERVVPEGGVLANATVGTDGRFRHHIQSSLRTLAVDSSQRAKQGREDLYFALASFEQGWHEVALPSGKRKSTFRTQDNVKELKSLWLDIDVGAGKDYDTTEQANQALSEFIAKTGFPKPTIVASGSGGLHVYWSFLEPVSRERWQGLANRLHSATIATGMKADPARTRDCASVLRVPGSHNFKGDLAKPVKLIQLEDAHPITMYESLLAAYEPAAVSSSINTTADMPVSLAELQSIFGGAPKVEIEIPLEPIKPENSRHADIIVAGCPQIRIQKSAQEPVWRGMLATLRHCIGGVEKAHELSKQHPGYSEEETNDKLQQLEDKDIPPYTCASFAAERPEICQNCQYRGIINSPISVPESRIAMVEVVEGEGDEAEVVVKEAEEGALKFFKPIDTGRYKVTEAGCYEWVKAGDQEFWSKVYEYPVYPIQRIRDRDESGELQVSYIFRKHHAGGHDDFQIGGDVLGGSAVSSYLGSVGLLVAPDKRKSMTSLLIDILKEGEATIEETNVANNLGWDSDHKNFLLGNKLYKPTGDVIEVTPKGKAQLFSAHTVPKGDLESWKEIANVYNKPGLEWAQVVIGTAFASPLMSMGGLEQAALLFVTGEKGVGKSTALQIALSVYGDPLNLMINKNDTALARFYKLGVLNSISATFDEMTDLSPKEASELAYQITQGRGKDRMGDMGKTMQQNTTKWSCLPVMSANDSIISALAEHSRDATAQMSRVLEVEATNFADYYAPHEIPEFQRKVRQMPKHYGVAGDIYARYVVTNQESIEDQIIKIERIFVEETRLTNSYRFWSYMCTRIIVGCAIAKKLGLIDFDIKRIFAYLKQIVFKSLSSIGKYEWKPDSVLSDYLNAHIANRIDVVSAERPTELGDDFDKGEVNDLNYVKRPLAHGRELHVRAELEERRMFISRASARSWCSANRIPYEEFVSSIEEAGLLVHPGRRITLGKGTVHRANGRSHCIEILMPDNE